MSNIAERSTACEQTAKNLYTTTSWSRGANPITAKLRIFLQRRLAENSTRIWTTCPRLSRSSATTANWTRNFLILSISNVLTTRHHYERIYTTNANFVHHNELHKSTYLKISWNVYAKIGISCRQSSGDNAHYGSLNKSLAVVVASPWQQPVRHCFWLPVFVIFCNFCFSFVCEKYYEKTVVMKLSAHRLTTVMASYTTKFWAILAKNFIYLAEKGGEVAIFRSDT